MKHRTRRSLTLADVIATVARFARDDHEVGLVVSDFIRRGIVSFPARHHRHRHAPSGKG